MVFIDTHCHLDASEFDIDRASVISEATSNNVQIMVVPAVHQSNFKTVSQIAIDYPNCVHALGIHPMYVEDATEQDLQLLQRLLSRYRADPKLVAVGEIGLDFFIPEISQGLSRHKQEYFYEAQLALACEFDLPVLLHVRRSQDVLLKYLRRSKVRGGIAHAFNGSLQQAHQFVERGFALGIGGAMTYPRALQIRRLASAFSLEALVLETDSPDIPPSWLHGDRRNEPCQIAEIARSLASLRGDSEQEVLDGTAKTAQRVLPGLAKLAAH